MKVKVKKEDDKTIVTNEEGKVILSLDKSITGDKDVAEIIKKLFKNVEVELE